MENPANQIPPHCQNPINYRPPKPVNTRGIKGSNRVVTLGGEQEKGKPLRPDDCSGNNGKDYKRGEETMGPVLVDPRLQQYTQLEKDQKDR